MSRLLTLATLFSLIFSPLTLEARQVVDRVIAVVDEEAITQSELDQLLFPLYEEYRTLYQGAQLVAKMNEARQNLLNQLVEDKLVYSEAKRLGVRVTQEEIEEGLREFKSNFKDEEEFQEALERQGLTLSKLRARFEERLAIRKLHQYEVRSKIIVTPKEIEEYYESHLAEFAIPDRIKVKSITVRKTEKAVKEGLPDNEARAQIEEIVSRIYRGEDFGELAKSTSEDIQAFQGGELGTISRGELIDKIDQVLFNLKPGDISPIIETDFGYHLFKVEERFEGSRKSLDEVRDTVQEALFQRKVEERFEEWINELKRNAYISIR